MCEDSTNSWDVDRPCSVAPTWQILPCRCCIRRQEQESSSKIQDRVPCRGRHSDFLGVVLASGDSPSAASRREVLHSVSGAQPSSGLVCIMLHFVVSHLGGGELSRAPHEADSRGGTSGLPKGPQRGRAGFGLGSEVFSNTDATDTSAATEPNSAAPGRAGRTSSGWRSSALLRQTCAGGADRPDPSLVRPHRFPHYTFCALQAHVGFRVVGATVGGFRFDGEGRAGVGEAPSEAPLDHARHRSRREARAPRDHKRPRWSWRTMPMRKGSGRVKPCTLRGVLLWTPRAMRQRSAGGESWQRRVWKNGRCQRLFEAVPGMAPPLAWIPT